MMSSRHRCIAGGCGNWLNSASALCAQHAGAVGAELAARVDKAYRERGWAPTIYTAAVREPLKSLTKTPKESSK